VPLVLASASALLVIAAVLVASIRRLKARAALEGKSLSEYLRAEIEELAEFPTLEEMAVRIAGHPPLAEGLAAPLVTTDGRLARSTGHRARIVDLSV
jgi:hypothetical protein